METIEREALVDVLQELTGVAIWMTGAECFGPEGRAHEGFVDYARPVIFKALELLEEIDPKDIENGREHVGNPGW